MPYDKSIAAVLYDGYSPTADPVTLTWADVIEMLSTKPDPACAPKGIKSTLPECAGRTCPAKVGVGWSPVDLSVLHRKNENVRAVTAVVIDIDHIDDTTLERVRVAVAEYTHIIHSTHNHNPPDDGCYRLVMPLSRPALPVEWPTVRRAIVEVLNIPADPVAKDLSRFYFLPTSPADVPFYFTTADGAEIDVDDALAAAAPISSVPSPTLPVMPSGPVDLGALRERIAQVRISKSHGTDHAKYQAEILGRVLDGEPLGTVGQLHGRRVCLAGMLGYQLPPGTPWESVLEILRPCLVATPLDEGNTLEAAIEKTRKLYEEAMRGRIAKDKQRAIEREKLKELVLSIRSKSITDTAEDLGEKWADALMLTAGGVRGNEHNAQLILACAPEVRGAFKWNEVTKRVDVVSGPFAGTDTNSLGGAAAAWLQRQYSFMGGEQLAAKALVRVARETPYDPIAEYLNELAWDQQPRIDTFLEEYFGADVQCDEGDVVDEDKQRYVRAVSRRWLISLVARALKPGCKVDTVLILEGEQGARKSMVFEALVGTPHFLDTALALGEKDAMQAIAGAWLVELAELASFRRAENEKVKQFLSSKIDKFRPPYGASIEESPRRCVFVGSTNEEGYLTDRTGNRRYWPVRVFRPNVEAVLRDRDLVLAEAVHAYYSGERWWLTPEESIIAARETESRLDTSTTEEAIAKWWYGEAPARRPKSITMSDVAEVALRLTPDRISHAVRVEIGHAMRRLGFMYRPRRVGGVRGRAYEPTQEMLEAPVQNSAARAGNLALVAAVKARTEK